MLLDQFNFDLPKELIAQNPLKQRSDSRLLAFVGGQIIDAQFKNLDKFLQAEDILVFNDAKVLKAKLYGVLQRSEVEIEFNLDQEIFDDGVGLSPDSSPDAPLDKKIWRAICKGSKKIKEGDEVEFVLARGGSGAIAARSSAKSTHPTFHAKILKKLDDGFCLLAFDAQNFAEKIALYGELPLPPYIKRQDGIEKNDEEKYQTIYARSGNAVAAPTAGLHFDDEIFAKLKNKGVKIVFATLNVGAGTFLPVRSEKITDHKMHEEYFEISKEVADAINKAKARGKRIIAVGTTSLRILESSADDNGMIKPQKMRTDIFIYPSYKFKIVDALITNFHLPKSTLFMLVCAAIGKENAFALYEHAIKEKYRFFSYGDSSFLEIG